MESKLHFSKKERQVLLDAVRPYSKIIEDASRSADVNRKNTKKQEALNLLKEISKQLKK